jgi:hemerythrin
VALLKWDASYSVNVNSCDSQHQQLFSMINKLHDAMKLGQGSKVAAEIVDDLENYAAGHFSVEEKFMAQTKYPLLDEHRAQHQDFVSKVAGFRKAVEADVAGSSIAVLGFLTDWLSKHILQVDKKYSSHLNANGVR